MNYITIIIIAIALAMDAFAVSITSGITINKLKIKNSFKIALFFGTFQALMPVLGWVAGISFRIFISGIDHWIAFGLLTFIGCKMIYESIKIETIGYDKDPLNIKILLLLSIATSIDALIVGTSFAFLKISIIEPIIIIWIITFLLSFFGVYLGNKLGHFFEGKIEIIGGIILICIGLKILLEHTI